MKSTRVIALNLLLSVVVIGLSAGALGLDRVVDTRLPEWLAIPGWLLVIIGAFLVLWAAVQLARRSGSSGAPGDPTRGLVSSGPYAYLRNPIYAGDGLILLGIAGITGSPSFLLITILYAFSIDIYVRWVEEPVTSRRLGVAYDDYRKAVPRWLPRFSK